MRIFIVVVLSLIALVLRINFSDLLSIGNVSFNSIIILLYFVTLFWNGYYGLYIGFLIGILYGTFFSVHFGFYSLVFSSLTFVIVAFRDKIYKYEYRSLIVLFIATFLAGLIELLVQGLSAKLFFLHLITNVLPESILTTIIGMGILYLIKRAR